MFFRRRKEVPPTADSVLEKNGSLYVEIGQEYDANEYETDSDYDEEHSSDGDLSHEGSSDENDSSDDSSSDGSSSSSSSEDSDRNLSGSSSNVSESGNSLQDEETNNKPFVDEETVPEGITESNGGIGDEKSFPDQSIKSEEETSYRAPPVNNHEQHDERPAQDSHVLVIPNKTDDVAFNDNETNESDSTESSPIMERRSLLALAAEHDRVDIIKTVLQPPQSASEPVRIMGPENTHKMVQFLLNDRFSSGENGPFLPPLHLAIASGSTNAATCLLRMGANPAIRPKIPNGWTPQWEEDHKQMEKKEDGFWKSFDGLSAWELAFGVVTGSNENEARSSATMTNGEGSDPAMNDQPASKKWFGGWSSSASVGDANDHSREVPFEISPSKLEGIKHAFTAEALRAIGADEVNRFCELLDSGLDHPLCDDEDRVDIGGKDLFGWCMEMQANKCISALKERQSIRVEEVAISYKNVKEGSKEKKAVIVETNRKSLESLSETESEVETQDDMELTVSPTAARIVYLRSKLEESESLATALSSMLDNLAEEASISQALVFQNGNSSNEGLLSQVRLLKQARAEKEDEISVWENRLSETTAELEMVLIWWEKRGGNEDILRFDESKVIAIKGSEIKQSYSEVDVTEMRAHLAVSENKVRKLRASINTLAEENTKNLEKIKELGLGGAVKLARTLREEVIKADGHLQVLKGRETTCRVQVVLVRKHLEQEINLNSDGRTSPFHSPKEGNRKEIGEGGQTSISRDEDSEDDSALDTALDIVHIVAKDSGRELENRAAHDNERVLEQRPALENANTSEQVNDGGNRMYEEHIQAFGRNHDRECGLSEGESSNDALQVNHSQSSERSYEFVGDLKHSDKIIGGISTAIVTQGQSNGTRFDIWSFILRVIGLGRESVKKTVASSGVDDLSGVPRVMIV
jgi:hypothetical protein